MIIRIQADDAGEPVWVYHQVHVIQSGKDPSHVILIEDGFHTTAYLPEHPIEILTEAQFAKYQETEGAYIESITGG